MYTDLRTKVSSAQAVTITAVSEDTYDANPSARNTAVDLGAGTQLFLVISCLTAGTPGAGTCQFEFITSAAAALSTPVVMSATAVMADEDIPAGMQIVLAAGPYVEGLGAGADVGALGALRYYGARYTCGTALPAGWTFDADIIVGYSDGLRFHTSGFTVT